MKQSIARPKFSTLNSQLSIRLSEAAGLTTLVALVLAGFLLAPWWRPAYAADLLSEGATSPLDLVGIHEIEHNADFSYRWTTGYAFAQLPSGFHAARGYMAAVRVRAANPSGPRPLTFLVNERPLLTVQPTSSFQTFRFVVPYQDAPEARLRLALKTEPFKAPGDPRELGVMISSVELRPIPAADWGSALALAAGLAALWLWLRWRGAQARGAAVVCAGLAALLLGLYVAYQPAPLAYPLLALLALGAAALAALLTPRTPDRLALGLLAGLVSFAGALWPSWITDDGLISFRYAQNLVAGNGLVYNLGERVEGYTNFLWTVLLALVLRLGGDALAFCYLSGVVLALALLLLTYAAGRRLVGERWALLAALLVGTSQAVLVYSARGSGLETALFTALGLAGSLLALRRPPGRSADLLAGAVFGLASLTRPEGLLLLGLTLLHRWAAGPDGALVTQRTAAARARALLPLLGAFLLIFAPYFAWRYSFYGDPLPNTFYAKTGGGLAQALRGLGYAGTFALGMGGPLLLLILAPLWGGRAALLGWRGYLLLLVGAYSAYIVAVGGDHFPGERFFVPLVPWIALLMADGAARLYARLRARPGLGRLAPAGLALLLTLYSGYALGRSAAFDEIIRGDDESVWIWREIGWWMADNAAPGESIAAMGAGAIAYYGDRETIDLLGLNDKHIARIETPAIGTGTAGHEKRDPAYVLNERKPTYIPKMWDDYFGGKTVLRRQYTLIETRSRYGRVIELWKRMP
jgi:hypothetical protein